MSKVDAIKKVKPISSWLDALENAEKCLYMNGLQRSKIKRAVNICKQNITEGKPWPLNKKVTKLT